MAHMNPSGLSIIDPLHFYSGTLHHPYFLRSSFMEQPTELPLTDSNNWYYPSHGHESDDDTLEPGTRGGNWGKKMIKGSRWVRRGKMTPWGPAMDDAEAEERARKRMKRLLPYVQRSPSPPYLPHMDRSPSPPLTSPYIPADSQHLSYTSFVMDKSVTHTFRSKLSDELEQATNGLIEGEAALRRALGRLWQVMSEDPDEKAPGPPKESPIPKREDPEGDSGDQVEGAEDGYIPDLTPPTHKYFLTYPPGTTPNFEQSHFASPETQLDTLEKSLAALRELQDDGREYVERLEEIRDGLGTVRAHRDGIWDFVRERSIKELRDSALTSV